MYPVPQASASSELMGLLNIIWFWREMNLINLSSAVLSFPGWPLGMQTSALTVSLRFLKTAHQDLTIPGSSFAGFTVFLIIILLASPQWLTGGWSNFLLFSDVSSGCGSFAWSWCFSTLPITAVRPRSFCGGRCTMTSFRSSRQIRRWLLKKYSFSALSWIDSVSVNYQLIFSILIFKFERLKCKHCYAIIDLVAI